MTRWGARSDANPVNSRVACARSGSHLKSRGNAATQALNVPLDSCSITTGK